MNHPSGDGSTAVPHDDRYISSNRLSSPVRQGSAAGPSTAEDNLSASTERPESGQLLLEWLSLLGWQTSIERNGTFSGVAHHVAKDDRRLEVRAQGSTFDHVVVQLFERAVGRLAAQ